MPTRPQESCRKQIGRGRRHQDPRQELIHEVAATAKKLHKAKRDHKKAVRKAQNAGIAPPNKEVSEPTFEVWERELHIFPGGLKCDHGHYVMRLAEELSPECLAELAEKVTNGRLTYSRPLGDEHGWWNHHPADDPPMAAD